MLNYLFSLNFLRSFSLLLFFSASAIADYKNTRYTSVAGGFIICTKEGVKKLYNKRKSQVENREIIDPVDKSILSGIPQDECDFRDTEVEFKRIATEYKFPSTERIVSDMDGEEPCPWAPEERCSIIVTAFPVHYVESWFLGNDGKWRSGAFVEMGASFKLLDNPEDMETAEEKDRNPDTLFQNTYQVEFLAGLTKELQEVLDKLNSRNNKAHTQVSMLQNNATPKLAIVPTAKPRIPSSKSKPAR